MTMHLMGDKKTSYARLCLPGLTAKFKQNPCLMTMLLNTGDKTIIESSYDKLWGTGRPLHEPDCLKPETWISQGILGELLMEVRQSVRCDTSSNSNGTLV